MINYQNYKINIKLDPDFNLFYFIIKDDQNKIIYDGVGCECHNTEAEATAEAKKTINNFY